MKSLVMHLSYPYMLMYVPMYIHTYIHIVHSLSIMYVSIHSWLCTHICVRIKLCCFIDPPAIIDIEVTEVCTNDFTVSWTAASNEEGLSYNVTLFLPGMVAGKVLEDLMNTSYNFTDLMRNTGYNVLVTSKFGTCVETSLSISVATLEVGLPPGELCTYCEYICSFEILHLFLNYVIRYTYLFNELISYHDAHE